MASLGSGSSGGDDARAVAKEPTSAAHVLSKRIQERRSVMSGNDTGTSGIAQFRIGGWMRGCGRENTYCEGPGGVGRLSV